MYSTWHISSCSRQGTAVPTRFPLDFPTLTLPYWMRYKLVPFHLNVHGTTMIALIINMYCTEFLFYFFHLSFSLSISLQFHGSLSKFNAPEKAEVLRRRSILLVYLLRSPFYDEYTKWVYLLCTMCTCTCLGIIYMHHVTLRSIQQDWMEKLSLKVLQSRKICL